MRDAYARFTQYGHVCARSRTKRVADNAASIWARCDKPVISRPSAPNLCLSFFLHGDNAGLPRGMRGPRSSTSKTNSAIIGSSSRAALISVTIVQHFGFPMTFPKLSRCRLWHPTLHFGGSFSTFRCSAGLIVVLQPERVKKMSIGQ